VDAKGAYNILRKSDSTFSFAKLVEKIRTPVDLPNMLLSSNPKVFRCGE
jgi:hypothetical protein